MKNLFDLFADCDVTLAVLKELDKMEHIWTNEQKMEKKENLKEVISKKMLRYNDFVDQLLSKCKELRAWHGGPMTSVKEHKKSPQLKAYHYYIVSLQQEIQYQRDTHQRDAEVICTQS